METVCGVKSYNKCSKCSLSALTQAHNNVLLLVYCPVDTLRCSKSAKKFAVQVCVKSLLLSWKPRSWF